LENKDENRRSVVDRNEMYFYLCEAKVLREHLIWKIPGLWEAALDEGTVIEMNIKFIHAKDEMRLT
jgi:hypothetical protein